MNLFLLRLMNLGHFLLNFNFLFLLLFGMLWVYVFDELVLSVILCRALSAHIWSNKKLVNNIFRLLFICMSSFMILAVTNCSKPLLAMNTNIRLLTCVCSHMHKQVSFLGEDFSTVFNRALVRVFTSMEGINMKLKSWSSWERFITTFNRAAMSLIIWMMNSFVVLKVLFQFKCFLTITIFTHVLSVRKLIINYNLINIRGSLYEFWDFQLLRIDEDILWMDNATIPYDLSNTIKIIYIHTIFFNAYDIMRSVSYEAWLTFLFSDC